jgi:two-component system, OmpR family, response regulator
MRALNDAPHEATKGSGMRILIADDDPRLCRMLQRALERAANAVDTAATGNEAFLKISGGGYDVLLLDIRLPDGSGIDLMRRLRAGEEWVPIVLMTGGGTDPADVASALDAGADDFVKKPFSLDELQARIRAVVRRKPQERPPVLVVGDLSLDPASLEVTRAGRKIDLTPKEFALLHLFMRRPGQVLSRRTILEAVWDFNYETGSNVVDVYVGYLRAKVDRPFGRRSIESVRGVGYRFVNQSRKRNEVSAAG